MKKDRAIPPITFEEFRARVRQIKPEFMAKLKACGLPENERVTVRAVRGAGRPSSLLGYYSRMSQFRSGVPQIGICWNAAVAVQEEIATDRGCGIDHTSFDVDLHRVVLDTLLHEYGHVIAEFARVESPDLQSFINEEFPDEEDFAEDFCDWFRGDSFASDAFYQELLRRYAHVLTENMKLAEAAAA